MPWCYAFRGTWLLKQLFIYTHALQEKYFLIHTKVIYSEFICRNCCLRFSINDLFVKKNPGCLILVSVFSCQGTMSIRQSASVHSPARALKKKGIAQICMKCQWDYYCKTGKEEKNGKLLLCTKLDMFIKTDMKKIKVGKRPYVFFFQHPFAPCPPPIFYNTFLKHNLPKVCACLVDFHFRCCQLKGIWTNQYLSVFWRTQSWLLEKSFL